MKTSGRFLAAAALLAILALVLPGCILSIDSDDDDDVRVTTYTHKTAHCPVDGDRVYTKHAPSGTYSGDEYYFCCNTCKSKFMNNPQAYLGAPAAAPNAGSPESSKP